MQQIQDFLLTGADHATSAAELAALTGLRPRQVTQLIEKARRAGVPVCAITHGKQSGYYLPETADELQQYCDRLHHRASELFITHRGCIQALKQMQAAEQHQQTLF